MRVVAIIGLIVLAAFLGFVAYGALRNLWADHQDNWTGNYLIVGLPPLACAIAALWAALQVWRRR